jgi:hypothetical protein
MFTNIEPLKRVAKVSSEVPKGSFYRCRRIARIYRSVVIQPNEVKCISNNLRFVAGEGWKPGTSNLLHGLWIVSEHQRMQDPAKLLSSCVTIQEWGWISSHAFRFTLSALALTYWILSFNFFETTICTSTYILEKYDLHFTSMGKF